MQHIEIIRVDSPLQRQVYNFWYCDDRHALILDYYSVQGKKSTRHKWVTQTSYNRLDSRTFPATTESLVPLDEDIKAQAKAKFIAALRIGRWSEFIH